MSSTMIPFDAAGLSLENIVVSPENMENLIKIIIEAQTKGGVGASTRDLLSASLVLLNKHKLDRVSCYNILTNNNQVIDKFDKTIVQIIPSSFQSKETKAPENKKSECEELYGPYPPAIPVPYLNKNNDTLSKKKINYTKTLFDVQPDYRDKDTPDDWIPRDGRLIRLTGRHPFNAEPPVAIHNKYRFITPSSLHYVRNHGAVPKLAWEDHTILVGGSNVPNPLELSMDQIATMESHELPVTLVCSANRRKEKNMIRQTIGFNWGPSACSTSVFRGARLRDILLMAGVSDKNVRGKYVELIGAEDLPNKVGPGPFKDDPWGKLVKYGTSIPLGRAMSPVFDVIVAYECNGEPLQPDHGFPVRVIVPGYTAGRMVKWLKKINVIDHETTNHYHYHDNRLLPPHITSEESIKGDWFYKPEYIINELNINSTITTPIHDKIITSIPGENSDKEYTVGGYSISGGGRKITRVEVSTDGGLHWRLAEIDRKEKPNDYGMHWCWIWWNYKLKIADLHNCKEIWCRAWDTSNNTQPLDATWNLMGMGTNQVFRVRVHKHKKTSKNGELLDTFRFEHPTQPGRETGGWMTIPSGKPESAGFGKIVDAKKDEVKRQKKVTTVASTEETNKGLFSMDEVRKHNKKDDAWIVVNNKVYDCTKYLDLHPGGANSILINAGEDCTEEFVDIHSIGATKLLDNYYIGDVDTEINVSKAKLSLIQGRLAKILCCFSPRAGKKIKEEVDDKSSSCPTALNLKKRIPFVLKKKTVLSHNSFLLDFALQSPDHILGLPTGKHLFLYAKIDGKTVMRRYTPVSSNRDVGEVKFIIKAYNPCEQYPEGGKFSQYLDSLTTGETVEMRGPVGEFEYISNGKYHIKEKKHKSSKFNMIAGGTGITPLMQIAAEILFHPEDTTQISLIFACREENDILMRSTLDEWAKMYPDRFQVHYTLSREQPEDWKYSIGYVNKKLLKRELYPPADDVHTLMCGPPIMLEEGCIPNLLDLGYKKDRIFEF